MDMDNGEGIGCWKRGLGYGGKGGKLGQLNSINKKKIKNKKPFQSHRTS